VIPLILGTIVGILTSYTDVKTSYIYEEHFFPTISILSKWWCKRKGCEYESKGPYIPIVELGILYNLFLGVKGDNLIQALSPFIGLVVGFAIGYFLYYTGGWASGDVIILGAYSALLPFAPAKAKYAPPYSLYLPLNSLSILFNSILLIFPLILIYSLIGLAVKGKFRSILVLFKEGLGAVVEVTLWLNFAAILFALVSIYLPIPRIITLILAFLIILLFGKFRIVGDIAGIASLAYGLYLLGIEYLIYFVKLFAIVYTFKLLWSSVKALRREVLIDEKVVEELKPGDVLGERIVLTGSGVVRDRSDFFDKLSKLLRGERYDQVKGEEVAGFSVEGLTEEQIERLKNLVNEGKLENKFLVRKAMPFAPALFLGFLTSYFFGDVLWWLILKVSGLA